MHSHGFKSHYGQWGEFVSKRSFAGFSYGDVVREGPYGHVYRGQSAEGRTVLVVEISDAIARSPGFADAIKGGILEVPMLRHPNVVGVHAIGRNPAGVLVAVTDTVEGVSLNDLLRLRGPDAGKPMPASMAAAVAAGLMAGLAAAHGQGIVHGALHPRSLWVVDCEGRVQVDDFAVGRALSIAAGHEDGARLFRGLGGFLPPELALGDEPDVTSDVYAAGAILFAMFSGEMPPGHLTEGEVSPAVAAVIARALATDRTQRYRDGAALADAVRTAFEEDGLEVANAGALADFASDMQLQADAAMGSDSSGDELDSFLAELAPSEAASPEVAPSEVTPPEVASPLESRDVVAVATEAPETRELAADPPRLSPLAVEPDDLSQAWKRQRSRAMPLLWGGTIVAIAGILVWVINQQATMREESEARAAQVRAEQEAVVRGYLADQPKPGRIVIESQPEEAAVWMMLGQTPLETGVMSTAAVHELRLELTGHRMVDVRVGAGDWQRDGERWTARVSKTLPASKKARKRRLPAYPPEPPAQASEGLPQGRGVIQIDSEPADARVWLLVGITPGVEVGGQTGASYEFKVLKDGHKPLALRVSGEDWQKHSVKEDRSDGHVPGTRGIVRRSVTLKRRGKK